MVLQGHEVRIGYFDQKLSDLDEDHSLIDEIRSVRGDWNEDVVRNYLGRFRFSGDDPFRKVKGLSGGERNRLTLAKMMLQPRNLLAMDEPTNHLDIPAREVLEEALRGYDGTVLIVSHDRFFLDRVVTRILHLSPATGRIEEHAGNYTDWKQRLAVAERAAREEQRAAATAKASKAPAPAEDEKQKRQEERQARKDVGRERERKQRRLLQLEEQIARDEAEVARLRATLAEAHGSDWQRLNAMVEDERKASARIKSLMGEWERLGAELEETDKTAETP
jgi:ATP-binding cassette subfamily F protein 3